jgi:hypothetical protein
MPPDSRATRTDVESVDSHDHFSWLLRIGRRLGPGSGAHARPEKFGDTVESEVALLKDGGERLEHVWNPRRHIEDDGHVLSGGAGGQPGGVLEQDLIRIRPGSTSGVTLVGRRTGD